MNNTSIIKSLLLSFVGAATFTAQVGCQPKTTENEAEVMWAVGGLSAREVETALRSRLAFRLNLKTNRATMFKDGVAVDQWNIASADVSGEWHNGQPQFTPTGIFNVEDIQMCPQWFPRKPVNPATGRVVSSEAERQRVIASNPQIYGACGSRNPLGQYVLWFNGAYGMHGNSAEEILRLANPEERRVSGGCVRNPNAKIKSVFRTVLDTFDELKSFSAQVQTMESRPASNRWTLTKGVANLNLRVIVGNWSTDPAVGTQVGAAKPPAPVATAKPNQPASPASPKELASPTPAVAPAPAPKLTGNKMSCYITAVDSTSGVAPVYLNVPVASAERAVSSFYRMGWPVTVFGKVEGSTYYKVSRGFIDEKFVANCSESI